MRNPMILLTVNFSLYCLEPNRLLSTIGGNREMHQLYMTSQVSNVRWKTNFLTLVDMFY